MLPLTPEQRSFITNTVLRNPYIPVKPTKKQLEYLIAKEREVFYGGAAGGGKSYALLMSALQYVEYPQYSALLLRRTLPELMNPPSGLHAIAKEWLLPTDAKMTDGGKIWTFPSGATITFGYLEHEDDKYRYQGSEYQCIEFDELTHFNQTQYEYLFSRLRKSVNNPVPLRMRSASNPGGRGHQWVKDRFIEPVVPEIERLYIPSKLRENPYLEQETYIANLQNLDPVTRAQYLDGNWDIQAAGNYFKRQWFEIVDEWPRAGRRLRFWDMAASKEGDYTVGALVALRDGVYYILDITRFRETPGQVEALIKQTAQLDGQGVAVRQEEEPGSSGLAVTHHYARQVLIGYDYKSIKSTGDKKTRAGPFSAAAEHGNVKVLKGAWNGPFLDELVLFPEGAHDDQVDAVSGAINALSMTDGSRYNNIRVSKMQG